MPRRNSLISRLRHGRAWDEWDEKGDGEDAVAPVPAPLSSTPRSRRRRIAVAVVFSALFVAGAAFSAAAGDQVRSSLEDAATGGLASTDATTTDPADTTSTDPAPVDDSGSVGGGGAPATPAATPGDSGDSTQAPAPATAAPPAASAPVSAPAALAAQAAVQEAATRSGTVTRLGKPAASTRAARPKFARTMGAGARQHHFPARKPAAPAPAPELDGASSGVVWLNRPLSDPTPPALRLEPEFARRLQAVARASHVNWALMLGVLRAEGHNGGSPAGLGALRAVAARLAQTGGVQKTTPWAQMFVFSSDTTFADRAVALSHYYRAVGLRALVHGLNAEKAQLGQKVLNDPRVTVYAGGRGDIEAGRVNVRVLAVIEYLADSFGQVTVSCLISGHRLYARPGVISAHIYGLAADISDVGGVSIFGHQQPGGITERAVRDLLLLPPEMMPKQVISLLGLGGPSFPLANHYNHIHIGY
jgi:hypothetical protein